MLANAPGLTRALADCTQPYAQPAQELLRSLETYLADPRSTDAVYKALVQRACTEPHSVVLVDKVVSLLKQYLLRFTPSPEVLALLEDFCVGVQDLVSLSDAGLKAVQYVKSCVRRLRSDRPGMASKASRGSLNVLTASGGSAMGRSRDSLHPTAGPGRLSASRLHVGAVSGRSNDRYGSVDNLPSPLGGEQMANGTSGGGMMSLGGLLVLPEGSRRPSGLPLYESTELGMTSSVTAACEDPQWAVPMRCRYATAAPAAGLGRTTSGAPPPIGSSSGWLAALPEFAPGVLLSGLAYPYSAMGGSPPPAPRSGAPITLATIHRCVLDLEEDDITRHMREILQTARTELQQQQQVQGGALHGPVSGGGLGGSPRRPRPARKLFHHLPYNQQEPLNMQEPDVAVVVEAVCGVRAASALAAVGGPLAAQPDEEQPADGSSPEGLPEMEGAWEAAFAAADFGQVCGGILMKLMMDMWLRSGPTGSYVLALRMLRGALRSGQPAVRARAFDVVYNLALHGAMLRTADEEAAVAAAQGFGAVPLWQAHVQPTPPSPFNAPAALGTSRPAGPAAPPAGAGQTPAAPAAGSMAASTAHHLASHSLGLMGSQLLESNGSLLTAFGKAGTFVREGPSSVAAGQQHQPQDSRLSAVATATAGAGASRLPNIPPFNGAPPSPSPSAAGATAGGEAPKGGATGPGSNSMPGFDRWLRGLLFRLMLDICESSEYSELVWQSALGCLLQLLCQGGRFVAEWAAAMPPRALAGILRACHHFNWSQELYCHLLSLTAFVLTRGSPDSSSDSADALEQRRRSGHSATASNADAASPSTRAGLGSGGPSRIAAQLAEFGGLDELLLHFVKAPTADSRAHMLHTVVVHCCGGAGTAGSLAVGAASGSGAAGVGIDLNAADAGGAVAAIMTLMQSLDLDTVALVLRGALMRPSAGMASGLADTLASAAVVASGQDDASGPPSPYEPHHHHSASYGGPLHLPHHHQYMHGHTHSTSSSLQQQQQQQRTSAAFQAYRLLLLPLLECLERCSASTLADAMRTTAVAGKLQATVAHIGGVAAEGTAAAWQAFKEVCCEETVEARHVAVHWLHQVLSAACRACHSQLQLLSPLTLKTSPEANKLAAGSGAAAAAGAAGQQGGSAAPQWNFALADALLHVVRETPLGCELLMAAISRVVTDQKEAAAAAAAALLVPDGVGGGVSAEVRAAAAAGDDPWVTACRNIMRIYYVGLQWVLQCGSPDASMPAVADLADVVLEALLQPPGGVPASPTGGPPLTPPPGGSSPSFRHAHGTSAGGRPQRLGHGAASGKVLGSQESLQQQQQLAPPHTGSAASNCGGLLPAQQLLMGRAAFDPDVLSCTPPELLVSLLQQCSQSAAASGQPPDAAAGAPVLPSAAVLRKGFVGRPGAPSAAAGQAAAASMGGGAPLRLALRTPPGLPAGSGANGSAAVGPWNDLWQDRRLALLLALMARCSLDPEAFARYSLSHVIKAQLTCHDLRCRYYAGVYLLKHWMLNQQDKYWRTLRQLIVQAQQLDDERLLDNPYLQVCTMLSVDHS